MLSFIALVTLFLTCIQTAFAKCRSYGLDYKDGKSYDMQRSSSSFAGQEQFSGCQSDTAHNVIVDPQGNESECSMTEMKPDQTPVQYVCDGWTYDSMYTGEWSIIIISNNGGSDPVNFQRDFYLDFGDNSGPPSATSTSTDAFPQTTLLAGLESSIEGSVPQATDAATESTVTLAFTLGGRGLPPLPTTLLRVKKRNETEHAVSSSWSEQMPEPTTTVEMTWTSHITSFVTVQPLQTPVRVPVKSLRPLSGWNGTSTHSSTWMLASSLMTAAPSTTMTVTVMEASSTPESTSTALAKPTMDASPAEDHVAPIAPTSLGKHFHRVGKSVAHDHAMSNTNSTGSGHYSKKFRMALLNGDKPDEQTRKKFVEERHRVLHGN